MAINFNFNKKSFQIVLFGNYDFFGTYDFNSYFKKKFKFDQKQLKWFLYSIPLIACLFIGIQIIFYNNITIETFILYIFAFFLFLRGINYIIRLQFKQYCTIIETIGYFVVNELLLILETSHSLKAATKYIILGNYPLFSAIFKKAMIDCHFGIPLEESIRVQLQDSLSGNIKSIFLNIIDIWENGENIATFSKKRILDEISEQITEESNKIDSFASLSSGLVFLSPPVILCFLLISGKMNLFFGFLILIAMILGSLFIHPDTQLTMFSHNNQLHLSYDKKSLNFLILLAENLSAGNIFEKSLNSALNTVIDSDIDFEQKLKIKKIAHFRLGTANLIKGELELLRDLFPEKALHLISLTMKFSEIDIHLAGRKLLTITNELQKINEILNQGNARRKAAELQATIIQFFALIALGIIYGASPFFLYIAQIINNSYTQLPPISSNLGFDLIFLSIGFLMSILPMRKNQFRMVSNDIRIPLNGIIRSLKFLLFLLINFIVKNFLITL